MPEIEKYKGWARCTCHEGPEKREQHRAELLPEGVTVEGLLFELNMLCCAWVEVGVDQWWGVRVDGVGEALYRDHRQDLDTELAGWRRLR